MVLSVPFGGALAYNAIKRKVLVDIDKMLSVLREEHRRIVAKILQAENLQTKDQKTGQRIPIKRGAEKHQSQCFTRSGPGITCNVRFSGFRAYLK